MLQNNTPTYKHLLKYSLWLLGRKEVSTKMLTRSLRKRFPEASSEDEDKVISFLSEKGYLSDSRFVESYVRYCKAKKWGPNKIRFKLKEKGISSDLIANFGGIIEESRVDELVEYCMSKFKLNDYQGWEQLDYTEKSKFKAKIMRHLASKGYGMGEVNPVIQKIICQIQ